MDEEANVIVANERHIVVVMPNLPDGQAIFVDNFVHAVVGILTREEFFSIFSEFDADGRQRISMTREGDVVVFKHLTRPPIYTRLGQLYPNLTTYYGLIGSEVGICCFSHSHFAFWFSKNDFRLAHGSAKQ